MRKGFVQLGFIVILASVFVGGILVNRLELSNSKGQSSVPVASGNNKASCEKKSDGSPTGNFWCVGCGGFCLSGSYQGGGCIQAEKEKCPGTGGGYGGCSAITGSVNIYYCKGIGEDTSGGCQRKDTLPSGVRWDSVNKRIVGSFCGVVQVDAINKTGFCSHYDTSGCTKPTENPTPTPTKSPSPTPTPSKTPSPSPTVKPTKSPSPTPTASPVPQCNSTCSSDSMCPSGLTCYKKYGIGTGYCRNVSCTKNSNCVCASPTPTPTKSPSPRPSPTATAGTATPTVSPSPKPEESKLIVCKYRDENGNGIKDSEDKLISWKFNYNDGDVVKSINSYSWNVFRKGCVTVKTQNDKNITVNEESVSGWELTGIYADSAKQTGGNYIYKTESGKVKEVWFLNKVNPQSTPTVGEPNSCNGTCGSNSNCKSGLFCYEGYCRIPENPKSSICATPTVLSATAPPELPKTGNNMYMNLIGMTSLAGVGMYLYRRFKLI